MYITTSDRKMNTYTNAYFVIKYTFVYYLLQYSDGYSLENRDIHNLGLIADLKKWFMSDFVEPGNIICCADGQWEASAFLSYGAVLSIPDTNSFFHYNGTGRLAFDEKRKKSYVSFNITAFSPQIPVYSNFTTTTIIDFKTGKSYQIDGDDNCMKRKISKDMQIACIPGTSMRLAKGKVDTSVVSTYMYQFRTSSGTWEQTITASVIQNGTHCDPVTVSHADHVIKGAAQGTLYTIDIVDIVHGIKDPTIFLLPKSCDNDTNI